MTLVDSFGRQHRDLRISLTDHCNLRCTYCMPEQGNEWLARSSILTLDEIERVARVAAAAGISTFRLTGGEPLLRPDIVDVVRRLSALTWRPVAGGFVAKVEIRSMDALALRVELVDRRLAPCAGRRNASSRSTRVAAPRPSRRCVSAGSASCTSSARRA